MRNPYVFLVRAMPGDLLGGAVLRAIFVKNVLRGAYAKIIFRRAISGRSGEIIPGDPGRSRLATREIIISHLATREINNLFNLFLNFPF